MRILYYNWVQFDDEERRGGGVTVYLKNLIEGMVDKAEIFFLSSGISYTFNAKARIVRTKNCFGNKCKSFEILNSPILAPGINAYKMIDTYLNDDSLLEVLTQFMKKEGPFDVIHFNNIEGLSVNVLKIKEIFPKTKIVFSLHNYYPFCPQVNLWQNEKCNCIDNAEARKCNFCITDYAPIGFSRNCYILAFYLKKYHIKPGSYIWKACFYCLPKITGYIKKCKHSASDSSLQIIYSDEDRVRYKNFLEKNVYYLNRYTDTILAVSKRVKEIAIDKGIDRKKICISYIGTKAAENQLGRCVADSNSKELKIAYLGYARRDKGFFFLLKALKDVPKEYTSKINLLFCAKLDDNSVKRFIYELGNKYHSVLFKNGYTQSEMKELLNDVNVGIVPVMWEDNLPQVAIEMVSLGIPILTSNLGGAKEIGRNDAFVFEAGNKENFVNKLINIMDNRKILNSFWDNAMSLVTISEHVNMLLDIYGSTDFN